MITGILFLLLFCHKILADGIIYRTTDTARNIQIPDTEKQTSDFIEMNGYFTEAHEVTTDDGYVLQMYRVLSAEQNDLPAGQRPVVMIQHGIAANSDIWVLLGAKSLPFMLLENNFDVWIGNTRGNRYAQKHRDMPISEPRFWDFSFHEQGYYDLAASIDYVLNVTKQKDLFLIGHSRGTTQTFVLLSSRPEYNEKIKLFVALAPVMYIKHTGSSLLKTVFQNVSPHYVEKMARKARFYRFPGLTPTNRLLRDTLCGQKAYTQPLCINMLFLITGFDMDQLNKSLVPILFSHFLDGGSPREYYHYMQVAQSDEFKQYDYGQEKNYKIYKSYKPPKYDLEKITAPISFHYGDNDFFTNKQDLVRLFSGIKNIAGVHRVSWPNFNHVDFLLAIEADDLVYKPIIKILKSYL